MNQMRFQKPATKHQISRPTQVILTGLRSAVIGPNLIYEAYRTVVPTVIVGMKSNVRIRVLEGNNEALQDPVILIPPGTLCEIQSQGDIAILFCDAAGDNYADIELQDIEKSIQGLRERLKSGPKNMSPQQFIDGVFSCLGITAGRPIRPEISRVVTALGREPQLFSSVDVAAELAGLSSMRFQHIFTELLGIPFRRYRQWRRMGIVIRALANGENLTEAAYRSGFSNSAHLATTFKAMFGLSPSDLIRTNVEYYLAAL